MAEEKEVHFPPDYRAARRAFIQACERAHVDSIARVHPTIAAPDGKPLFIDSAALGPRHAAKGLLVIAGGDGASTDALATLLAQPLALPKNTRLVLVHGMVGPSGWPEAMLSDILTEDMAQVETLRLLVLSLGQTSRIAALEHGLLEAAIRAHKPGADIKMARLTLGGSNMSGDIQAAARAALATL